MDLRNHYALITNCENTIAAAFALAFARNGVNLAIHYSALSDQVSMLMNELRSLEIKIIPVEAPIESATGVELIFEGFRQSFGQLDIVVNVLGDPEWQDLPDITLEDWNKSINNNLLSSILVTQYAARMMLTTERESPAFILHVMNIQGIEPQADNFQYAIGTAGVLGLIRKGAYELAPNIRVNGIVIGELDLHESKAHNKKRNEMNVEYIPLRRVGKISQLGEFAIALATNDFITGAIIPIDGGVHLTIPPRNETSIIDGFEVG